MVLTGAALGMGVVLGTLLLFALGLYLLPTLIAISRGHHQTLAICLLNVVLGWTILGWVVAMVWVLRRDPPLPRKFVEATTNAFSSATQTVVVLGLGGWALTAMLLSFWQHFEESNFAHFQSLLPDGVDITRVDYVGEGGFSTPGGGGCGGAFLKLKKETSDAIKREGISFFNDRLRARKFREGNVYYIFRGWRETPLSEDARESDEWRRGLSCMGLDDTERRELEGLLKAPGSYWAMSIERMTVIIPKLDRVIIAYFEL